MDDDSRYRTVSRTFSMTTEMYDEVLEAARLQGVNRSNIVRQAIRQYLDLAAEVEISRPMRQARPRRSRREWIDG